MSTPNRTVTRPPSSPTWHEATLAVELPDGGFLLDDGRMAQPAASCLIVAAAGDRVLTVECRRGECYIVHVLTRSRPGEAVVSVPGAVRVSLCQAQIDLQAQDSIALRALHDIDITAAGGTLRLSARNLFTQVSETLVQSARHYVGRAEHYLLEVKKLLRLQGKQVMVTAEKDVKVDGERISMG